MIQGYLSDGVSLYTDLGIYPQWPPFTPLEGWTWETGTPPISYTVRYAKNINHNANP